MTSRVQDGEQSVGTATTAPAHPVLYEDALFLLIAEGRMPNRSEFLVFLLGFAASMSLVFITSDLMNARSLQPPAVLVFLFSATYCGVLVRKQRIAAAEFAAEQQRLAAEARRPPSVVIDRETRRQLLDYFVFRPPENNKKGGETSSINAISSSFGNTGQGNGTQQEESDAIGGSGRGARFSKSVRGVFSRLPTLSNPPPPNANARESNTAGDCEEGGLAAAAAGGSSMADKSRGEHLGDKGDSVDGAKESAEKGGISDTATKNATGLENEEVNGEGSATESCIVCFGDYTFGEELCRLPCRHLYHAKCIDEWFDGENHGWCPLCKTDVVAAAASARSVTANSLNGSSSSASTTRY